MEIGLIVIFGMLVVIGFVVGGALDGIDDRLDKIIALLEKERE